MYGWYSQKMAEYRGVVYYDTKTHGRVGVTSVTDGPTHAIAWDDVRLVADDLTTYAGCDWAAKAYNDSQDYGY